MQRIKVSSHFNLDELVPKEIYMQYYEKSKQFLDPKGIQMLEGLRTFFNTPIIVNDWWSGGLKNYCGFRPPDYNKGSVLSQHKFGRGYDVHFPNGTNYEKIRQIIRDKYDTFKSMGITTIEKNTPAHLHIDCRWTGMEDLYEVQG